MMSKKIPHIDVRKLPAESFDENEYISTYPEAGDYFAIHAKSDGGTWPEDICMTIGSIKFNIIEKSRIFANQSTIYKYQMAALLKYNIVLIPGSFVQHLMICQYNFNIKIQHGRADVYHLIRTFVNKDFRVLYSNRLGPSVDLVRCDKAAIDNTTYLSKRLRISILPKHVFTNDIFGVVKRISFKSADYARNLNATEILLIADCGRIDLYVEEIGEFYFDIEFQNQNAAENTDVVIEMQEIMI